MTRLKSRLSEVEGRMNKLMTAIQTVQCKTSSVVSEMLDESDCEEIDCEPTGKAAEDAPLDTDSVEEMSSLDDSDEVTELDRLEVEQVYDGLDGSSSEDVDRRPRDMETGGVRKRTVQFEEDSDEESY